MRALVVRIDQRVALRSPSHQPVDGTPQEKKRLSLEKDRRNTYGENDKASRKNIPRAKSRVNRANRHSDRQILDTALGVPDQDVDDATEQHVVGRRRKSWRTWPDKPLGEVLARRQARRGGSSGT